MVADVVDVRHHHEGHASFSLQSLSQAGVEPRAVHHHVALRSLLSGLGLRPIGAFLLAHSRQSRRFYWAIRVNRSNYIGPLGSIGALFLGHSVQSEQLYWAIRVNRSVVFGPFGSIRSIFIGPFGSIGALVLDQSEHFVWANQSIVIGPVGALFPGKSNRYLVGLQSERFNSANQSIVVGQVGAIRSGQSEHLFWEPSEHFVRSSRSILFRETGALLSGEQSVAFGLIGVFFFVIGSINQSILIGPTRDACYG